MHKINSKDKNIQFFNKAGEHIHTISLESATKSIADYSNGLSVQEVCVNAGISPASFEVFKKEFEFTRDSLPLLPSEILSGASDELLANCLIQRTSKIKQCAEKLAAKNLVESAKKWDSFVAGEYKPFAGALKRFKTTLDLTGHYDRKPVMRDKTLIVTLSDTHGGGFINAMYAQDGKGWDKTKYKKFMDDYLGKVREFIDLHKPNEIEIFGMGDLFDGLRGQTEKGTLLDQDASYDEQFDLVLDSVSNFISGILVKNIKTNIRNVRGNHDSSSCYILFETIKRVFRNEKNLTVYNYHTQFGVFTVKNTLFAISHGAHDKYKAKVPSGDRKQSYYQSVFLQHKHLLKPNMNCVAVMGDMHHREMKEYADFDFYMVGSPAKSHYGEALNLKSKPSQTCFLLNDQGVEAVLNCYF